MRRAVAGVAIAGVLVAGPWAGLVPLTIKAMTPKSTFAEQVPPKAPDYTDDTAWSALPGRVDAADVAPDALPAGDQTMAPADVFYIHPTSYLGNRWNGPFDDPKLQRASDDGGARIQASAFNACCAVYAPYYRQANGTAFFRPSADGNRALDVAYGDIRAAFAEFQRRRGSERPFLVAAHSQGAIYAERLLAEEVAGKPLREQLVAAWLAGGAVHEGGIAPDLAPCRTADDLHCVIGWNARRPGWEASELVVVDHRPGQRLCTNPLRWTTEDVAAPASEHRGAVFLDVKDTAPRPGFASARCEAGMLMVDEAQKAPRGLMSAILDDVVGEGNLHPIEYQLYWVNLRENAGVRVRAALAEGSAEPAGAY